MFSSKGGASLTAVNYQANTALHYAYQHQQQQGIGSDVDPTVKNNLGYITEGWGAAIRNNPAVLEQASSELHKFIHHSGESKDVQELFDRRIGESRDRTLKERGEYFQSHPKVERQRPSTVWHGGTQEVQRDMEGNKTYPG